MANSNGGYWSRSWALLTMHEGWLKPVLALAAARLVPIVGPFGADGYALEWGRLTAWGVDAAPKQKGVDIGACIISGARAFVIALGYGIVLAFVNTILSTIFGSALGGIVSLFLGAIAMILTLIAKLRATIYQSIGAGFQLNRIGDMIKRDSNGLFSVVGLAIVIYGAIGLVSAIVITLAIALHAGPIVMQIIDLEESGYVSDARMMRLVFTMLASMLPTIFVLGFLLSVVNTVASLIMTTATSLWMRQFDVQHWGQSADPLPTSAPTAAAAPSEPAPSGWAATETPSEPAAAATSESGATWPGNGAAAPSEPAATWPGNGAAAPSEPTTWQTQATDGGVPTFSLDDFGTSGAPAAAPQVESAAPLWPAEPQAAGAGVPTFTLDNSAPSAASQTAGAGTPTFTLDDSAPVAEPQIANGDVPAFTLDNSAASAAPQTADAGVPTFTLDDSTSGAAPSAVPQPPYGGVTTFALDDSTSGAAPSAVPQPPYGGVPTFTLDEFVSAPAPVVEPKNEPMRENYQGPVENDEDARRALASLDLPVKPFDHVVGTKPANDADEDVRVVEVVDLTGTVPAAEPEPESKAEQEAPADDSDVPTFSLDDFAAPEEPNEANE